MLNLGTVQQDSTIYIPIPTRAADGAASTGNTLADGDFAFHKDGSTTASTIDAAATTPSSDFASTTGRNQLAVDLSADSDFTAGSFWQVWLSKSIATETVEECVAVFRIESNAEKGVRLLNEIYASHTVGATGNDSTHVHLSGIDAGQGDDELNGELLLLYDVSEAEFHFAVITDFATTGDLATVQNVYNGSALPFTPASGDYWFRVGVAPLQATVRGRSLDVSTGGEAGVDWANVGSPTTTVGLSGTTVKTATDVATATTAIKAKTDSLTFTTANIVDANAERINNTAVQGAGTSGDKWRGA